MHVLATYVTSLLLVMQTELMQKVSRYVSQLHRTETGDVFTSFDRQIAEENTVHSSSPNADHAFVA